MSTDRGRGRTRDEKYVHCGICNVNEDPYKANSLDDILQKDLK